MAMDQVVRMGWRLTLLLVIAGCSDGDGMEGGTAPGAGTGAVNNGIGTASGVEGVPAAGFDSLGSGMMEGSAPSVDNMTSVGVGPSDMASAGMAPGVVTADPPMVGMQPADMDEGATGMAGLDTAGDDAPAPGDVPVSGDGMTDRPFDPMGSPGGEGCTRGGLAAAVEKYFVAIAAHDPSMLTTTPDVRFTEDGAELDLGQGMWATAGALQFKRSLLDLEQCESLTEAVLDNGGQDFILGLRLKLDGAAVSEIEAITVGPDGWFANADLVAGSRDDDWETTLPEAEQPTRAELQAIVDDYFELFGSGSVAAYPFASRCTRAENGFSPGACDFGIPMGLGGMTPLHYILDVESGSCAGFVLFAGGLLDVHMFKVRSGEVTAVRAVVGPRVRARGWD